MAYKLPRWRSNIPVLQTALNTLAEAIEQALNKTVTVGPGMLASTTHDGGICLEADTDITDSAPPDTFPFQIYKSVDDSGQWSVTVAPGTLNLIIPADIRSSINADDTAETVILLAVVTDGKQITTATLSSQTGLDGTEPPGYALGAAPASFKVPLGIIAKNEDMGASDAIEQIVRNNLTARIALAGQTEKSTIALGASPWNNFWTWLVEENKAPLS